MPTLYQQLIRRLKKIERRLRLQEAVRLLPYGVLAGGVIGLAVAIYSRLTPSFTLEQVTVIGVAAVGLGVLGVLVYALTRPRLLLDTARRVDVALGLKERLSTAIEGHQNPARLGYAAMGGLQFDDARRSVENLNPNKALPLQVPRRQALASIIVLPLLALSLLAPNPFSDQVKENQVIKAKIEEQAQKIEELKKKLIEQNPESLKNDPKLQELLKQLEQAKKDLLDKSNNKEEALAALDKAQQELEKLGDPNKSTAEKAALESLARTFNSSEPTKAAGQALQQNSADRFENAAKELEKLANGQGLEQLKKDPAQAQQLSDKLAQEAKNFQNSNPQMAEKLQQLSGAVSPNNLNQNPAQAQQALKDVARELRQSGQNQQLNEQLQQAQAQLQKSEQQINQAAQQSQNSSQGKQNQPGESNQDPANGPVQENDLTTGEATDPSQGQQGQAQQSQQQGQQPGQQQGQGQGQQPGQQQGQGQGQQPGQQQGQGQGQQQGQGQGQGQEQGQGQGQGDETDQQGQGSKAGKGSSDNVYANPTIRRDQGTQTNIQGKNGQGPTNNQNVNGGNPSGEASVPYTEVLDAYQQQAAQQLDKNYVPLTIKDMVKQYFEDLNKKDK